MNAHRTAILGIACSLAFFRAARAEEGPTEQQVPQSQPLVDTAQELARQGEQLRLLEEELTAQREALHNTRKLAERLSAVEQRAAATPSPTEPVLRWTGYVQVDWVVHNQLSHNEVDHSGNSPLNQDRFTLRRGRLRAEAQHHWYGAALEVDANTTNGAQLRPVNAEVNVHWPEQLAEGGFRIRASAGLVRIPFGFELQESNTQRPFLERSQMLRALFPGEYDVGARLGVGFRAIELSIAAMNGHPAGDRVFPLLAPSRSKDILGRLGAAIDVSDRVQFHVGISAEAGTGFHTGTPTTKDQLTWRDDNGDGIVQATEIQVIAGSTGSASTTFNRHAIGADATLGIRWYPLGELALRAEVIRAVNLDRGVEPADPVGAGYDLRELGWYIGAAQEITPYALIGVRYDRYNPDKDAAEQVAARLVPGDRSYSTLALLAMARYENARLSIEYDKNGNALGRDASGAPTTLKCDSVTIRGQVVF